MPEQTTDAPELAQDQPRRKKVFIRAGGTQTIPEPEKEVTPDGANQS